MCLIFSIIILLFSSIILISFSMALSVSERIFYGVTAADIPIGGHTVQEAQTKLEQIYHSKLDKKAIIRLHYKDKSWNIMPSDIDFYINFEQTAKNAYQIGRGNNILQSFWERFRSAHHGIKIPYVITYDETKLRAILWQIGLETATERKDAYIELENDIISIVPEVTGQKLNHEDLLSTLAQKLFDFELPVSLELPVVEDVPNVTKTALEKIDTVLSVYSSNFNHFNTNRSENIRIAANSINHLLLRPDEVISFNDLTGLRIAEAGFKEAPVIIEGKTVPDIGGGVCQVSSTLYNSILLADMTPVERTPHFHPLGYVPIGLDATVADHLLDFKFKNTLANNAYIIAKVADGTLTIAILGNLSDRRKETITLTSNVDKTLSPGTVNKYDPNLPAGKMVVEDKGLTGYIVSSYRIKSINGQEISRQLLYVDEYSPEDQIVVVGTKLSEETFSPKKSDRKRSTKK